MKKTRKNLYIFFFYLGIFFVLHCTKKKTIYTLASHNRWESVQKLTNLAIDCCCNIVTSALLSCESSSMTRCLTLQAVYNWSVCYSSPWPTFTAADQMSLYSQHRICSGQCSTVQCSASTVVYCTTVQYIEVSMCSAVQCSAVTSNNEWLILLATPSLLSSHKVPNSVLTHFPSPSTHLTSSTSGSHKLGTRLWPDIKFKPLNIKTA